MDSMYKSVPNPNGKSDALFRILIIAAVLILFALIFYVMFGPLPNQKNFVTKGGTNSGVLNQLQVNETSLLKGNVTTEANVTVGGDETVDGTLNAHTTNFVTTSGTTDTVQGKITPLGGGVLNLQSGVYTYIKDLSGNNTASFKTSTKETTFYGNVNIDDTGGVSGLTLLNQTSSNYKYKFTNDATSNNLMVKSIQNSTIKSILDAEQTGGEITFLDDTIVAPKVYVNGSGGKGQVYDTIYNPAPAVDPDFSVDTLTVSGISTFNDPVTIIGTVGITGDLTITTGDIIIPTDTRGINFTASGSGNWNQITFGADTPSVRQRLVGFASGDTYLQTNTKVGIQNSAGTSGIAMFDTRPNTTGRNTYLEPFVDIIDGYLRITLPEYGTNTGPGGVIGDQVNSYTYTLLGTPSYSASNAPWSVNTQVLAPWNSSSQTGANGRLVTASSTPLAGWSCPKKGIWAINYNSFFQNGTTPQTTIGNITTNEVYGDDNISTFAVINLSEIVAVYTKSGGSIGAFPGVAGPPILTFNLIMELN
jgi:hypothetical protein